MNPRAIMLVLVAAASAGGCGATPAPQPNSPTDTPPIFAPARIHSAVRTAGMDRLVVVDFTASWCGPCKLMERTVWSDPRVEDWMERNRAVFVRSDADAHTTERDAYGVNAWPTTIILRQGEVVERRLGYQSVEQLLGLLSRASGAGVGTGIVELKVLPPERSSP
ncbi:MAG TPA: thioredoxin family protein [Phycisphaerales bacterium]|nr:thioredoxin family protein [Phycisphaerales bacterium]